MITDVKNFLLLFLILGSLLMLLTFFSKNFFYFLKTCIENLIKNFKKRALLKPQKRINIIMIVV